MVCQALWERDLDVVLTELDRMDEEEERKGQRKLNDMGSKKSYIGYMTYFWRSRVYSR